MESRNRALFGTREFSQMRKITRTIAYFVINDSEIPDWVSMEILLLLSLENYIQVQSFGDLGHLDFVYWTTELNLEIFSSDIGQWRYLKVSGPQVIGAKLSGQYAKSGLLQATTTTPRAVIATGK
ncbi:unnamed protein product [Dovyalis caffra]|uniref:Uncharacterized protein n=1 Tax=Dovyalis caffra TaxID=77055 RepID=A0AAV1R549_9ROSI|nr:unnamed protein product [Dovyalis caffra]